MGTVDCDLKKCMGACLLPKSGSTALSLLHSYSHNIVHFKNTLPSSLLLPVYFFLLPPFIFIPCINR